MDVEITQEKINKLYERIKKDAQASGYYLNPDVQFTKDLVKGLLINETRYGYQSCPCRLSLKDIQKDRDIICPCDYRDVDLSEYGACYCGLYVSEDVYYGKKKLTSIPERRNLMIDKNKKDSMDLDKLDSVLLKTFIDNLKTPIWRCKVCGYLCAREYPPEICPICKVKKDRFERFL